LNGDACASTGVNRVKVWRIVVVGRHEDHDPVEGANPGHDGDQTANVTR